MQRNIILRTGMDKQIATCAGNFQADVFLFLLVQIYFHIGARSCMLAAGAQSYLLIPFRNHERNASRRLETTARAILAREIVLRRTSF
jgi:hypothetical protein